MFIYYTSLTFLSVFGQIILLHIISTDHLLPKESKHNFKLATYTIMAIALSEWTATLISNISPEKELLINLFLFIMQILSPILPLIVGRIFKKYDNINALVVIILINTIMHILTFTNLLYISSSNLFAFGNIYMWDDIIFMVCLVIMSLNIFSFCKNYQSSNVYILILTIVLMAYANGLRTLRSDYRVVWFAGTVGLIFMYAYYSALVNKIDSLTHLLNRRCFDSRFQNLKYDSYIVIIDLNKFKEINDTQGHRFGDYILTEIAEIIKKAYHKHGICFRIGGDEFCVIVKMKNCDIESLNKQVNNIIQKQKNREPLLPTVSIGYGEFKVGVNTPDGAFALADAMMYEVKRKSRNK